MLFRVFIVIDTNQEKITMIIFQGVYVFFSLICAIAPDAAESHFSSITAAGLSRQDFLGIKQMSAKPLPVGSSRMIV